MKSKDRVVKYELRGNSYMRSQTRNEVLFVPYCSITNFILMVAYDPREQRPFVQKIKDMFKILRKM